RSGTVSATCTAQDAAGNVSSASMSLTLIADTAPVIRLPSPITADATKPSGATVSYAVTATDNADPSPSVTCAPRSGSLFPINAVGTFTLVSCTATDASGNAATGSFTVHVNGAAAQLQDLADLIDGFNLKKGKDEKF